MAFFHLIFFHLSKVLLFFFYLCLAVPFYCESPAKFLIPLPSLNSAESILPNLLSKVIILTIKSCLIFGVLLASGNLAADLNSGDLDFSSSINSSHLFLYSRTNLVGFIEL